MTKKKFLEFGAKWNYLQLVLAPKTAEAPALLLKHGKESWEKADRDTISLAVFRLKQNRHLPELMIDKPAKTAVKSGEKLDYFRQHQARKAREKRARKASGASA